MATFRETLEDTFRGRKVRAAGKEGIEYIGYVQSIDTKYRHLILRDAVREDGGSVGAVAISDGQHIELIDDDLTVEDIPLVQLTSSPYACGEYQEEQNQAYIADVRRRGGRRTFPTVRPVDEGYEMVDGNKTLWVCRQANLDSQACKVVDLSDWQAAVRFAEEHIPPGDTNDEGSDVDEESDVDGDWYRDDEIEESIKLLYADWGDRIRNLHRIEFHTKRLDISFGDLPS